MTKEQRLTQLHNRANRIRESNTNSDNYKKYKTLCRCQRQYVKLASPEEYARVMNVIELNKSVSFETIVEAE